MAGALARNPTALVGLGLTVTVEIDIVDGVAGSGRTTQTVAARAAERIGASPAPPVHSRQAGCVPPSETDLLGEREVKQNTARVVKQACRRLAETGSTCNSTTEVH